MTRIQELEIEIATKASLEKSLRDDLNVAESEYLKSRQRWWEVYMARQDAERELVIEQRVAARACGVDA